MKREKTDDMKMNMRLLGVMVLLGTCMSMSAQTDKTAREDFDGFRKKAEAEFSSFRDRMWAQYQAFRDSINQEYAEFMKQAWVKYESEPAIPKPHDREFKPTPMPKEDWNMPFENKPILIDEVVPPVVPTPQPVPIAPIPRREEFEEEMPVSPVIPQEEPVRPQEEGVEVTFFGTSMRVRFSDDLRFQLNGINENSVPAAWIQLSDKKYNNLIRDCLALRMKHQLCDWAYLSLLEKIGIACMGQGNEATLLTAFIYAQSGYKMRLANDGTNLFMLYATDYALYDKVYYTIDGTSFVVMGNKNPKQLYICNYVYPNEQFLSMTVTKEQLLDYVPTDVRKLQSLNHPEVECSLGVNKNLIDFFNEYPRSMYREDFMTHWALYANTPLQQKVCERLYPALKKHIKGKTEHGAVSVILDFVQTAFPYGYDDKIWHYDRAFFAEETLFYPNSDCEDHAILFSRLVRDLVGLPVVLVYYPGHLATAVCFSSNVPGDYLTINGKRYVVCDPTYTNAPVGMTMTDMDNSTAKAILLE